MPLESDAASLAAAVLAASTPKAAAAAVTSVADFLRRHAGDGPRAFFADALPALLFRLFVASPSSPSFVDLAAGDAELAGALASLLRPDGPLLEGAFDADRCALLQFAFPSERLPRWLRLALASAESDEVVSPLLAGRIGSELHLSVFEYYLFWFAYYPISAAATPTTTSTAPAATLKASPSTSKPFLKSRSRLESWVSNLASTAGRSSKQKVERPLYLKLLYAYLKEFVPSACVPPRGGIGTLLRRTFSEAADAAESFRRAEFFVHTLVQFWLVGDDFSPLPVQTSRAYGVPLQPLQSRVQTTVTERPPSPGLGNAVKLLVMYLNTSCGTIVDASNVFEGMPVWKKSSDVPLGYWNQFIQRPMYRFLLRTFLFCPMGGDMEHAAQVFSAWMVYLEPWKVQQEDFEEYDLPQSGVQNVYRAGEEKRQLCEVAYTPAWQGYVLSNYLFYSSLLVHFLGFAHKFIHSDVALVLQMVSKVLEVLCSSNELLELIHNVDAAYHSRQFTCKSYSMDQLLKYVPSIREQLKDWEDGLSESDGDGSLLHERRNSDLRLFSVDEEGAYNLLQLLLLRAESEIQRFQGDAMQTLQTLDSVKSQMKKIFCNHVGSLHPKSLPGREYSQGHVHTGIFAPKHPGFRKSPLADAENKGDWMTRPISDTEVGWLAKMLIHFSVWLNETLHLGSVSADATPTGLNYIKFDSNELSRVGGPKDAARMVFIGAWALVVLVGQSILHFMRMRGIKINLRFLASKKLLAAAMLYIAFSVARNVLS
ncbi:hypothetical protein QOZ80_2BG0170300 [Eleusine coracana subsp. coracana]|nr:hypothetical protein QOZ80_2BG0170300 [Eleusine coracana subsp. coracana]